MATEEVVVAQDGGPAERALVVAGSRDQVGAELTPPVRGLGMTHQSVPTISELRAETAREAAEIAQVGCQHNLRDRMFVHLGFRQGCPRWNCFGFLLVASSFVLFLQGPAPGATGQPAVLVQDTPPLAFWAF